MDYLIWREAKAETTHTKASASLTYKNNDNDKQPDSTVGTGLGVEGSAMFSVAVGRVGVAAGAQAGWRGGVYSTYSTNPNHIKGGYSEKNLKAVVAIGLEEKEEKVAHRKLGAKVDLGVKADIFEQTYKFE